MTTDRTLVGLLYTDEPVARWCWYIGRDWSQPLESRNKALVELEGAISIRGLRGWGFGADRPIRGFLTEIGCLDQMPKPRKAKK